MPTVNPAPIGPKPQILLADGTPAVGYKLFFYVAGSVNTKQNTYTDSTGGVANTNPVVLNSLGEPSTQIWFTAGQAYKVVLAPSTDTDPPTSPVWSIDNLRGINDTTVSVDQWVAGASPTYVSGTSFTLAGDQTSTYTIGRRLKFTVTAGTVYGRILTSSYAALTTITLVMDGSQALDSGLSAVSYGLLTNDVLSIPARIATTSGTDTYTASVGASRYVTGDQYLIKVASASTSTAPTLNLDSLGAKTIKTQSGGALSTGQLNGEHLFRYNGTDMIVLNPITASTIVRGSIAGLTMSTAGSSSTMTVAAGQAVDSTNTVYMSLASAMSKTTSAWAAGTGNGGLDTGAIANNTWYHFYEIATTGGTVDVVFSTNATTPTLPGGYSLYRRIGSGKTNGSAQWIQFTQFGEMFRWTAPPLDVSATAFTAYTSTVISVPTGVQVLAFGKIDVGTGGSIIQIRPVGFSDAAPTATATPLGLGGGSASTQLTGWQQFTDTSAQISIGGNTTVNTYLTTEGWFDYRGRFA